MSKLKALRTAALNNAKMAEVNPAFANTSGSGKASSIWL